MLTPTQWKKKHKVLKLIKTFPEQKLVVIAKSIQSVNLSIIEVEKKIEFLDLEKELLNSRVQKANVDLIVMRVNHYNYWDNLETRIQLNKNELDKLFNEKKELLRDIEVTLKQKKLLADHQIDMHLLEMKEQEILYNKQLDDLQSITFSKKGNLGD